MALTRIARAGWAASWRSAAGCIVPLLVLLVSAASCSRGPDSPDAQLRLLVAEVEAAVEARDVPGVMAAVAENFRDAQGRNREEISRLLRGFFIAHQSIHLLSHVERLDFPADGLAELTLTVGMVGREAEAGSALQLDADAYEFELALERQDEEWRVTYVDWRPVLRH